VTDDPWWTTDLRDRFRPRPEGLRPGAEACWCNGEHTGREYRPGWLECTAHAEGPVRWYGGAVPLPISNGAQTMSWRVPA
jgi:hypothetical protein